MHLIDYSKVTTWNAVLVLGVIAVMVIVTSFSTRAFFPLRCSAAF